MNIPYAFKRCTKCGEVKLATTEYFKRDKRGKFGLRSECKVCTKAYSKKWRQNNAEQIKKYNKEYYKNNAEQIKKCSKEYYKNNAEQIKKRNKEYDNAYNNSPQGQVNRFNGRCRRRAKEEKQGNGITTEQWLECMQFFGFKCAYSGMPLNKGNRSLDHVTPLNLGGENEIWNVVPMIKNFNASKNDKEMPEWYESQEFYSEKRLQRIYEWQEYAYKKWNKVASCAI